MGGDYVEEGFINFFRDEWFDLIYVVIFKVYEDYFISIFCIVKKIVYIKVWFSCFYVCEGFGCIVVFWDVIDDI